MMTDIDAIYNEFSRYLPLCATEEELREMFSMRVLPKLDIPDENISHIRHEYSVVKGRIDSLYGSVILEFKAVGEIPFYATDKKLLTFRDQVTRHIKGIAKQQKIQKETVLGIIFDGKRVVYQQLVNGAEIIRGPYELNSSVFESFIDRLVYGLTVEKVLTQANLIRDFGLSSLICVPTVRSLYYALRRSTSKRTQTLFKQWKIYFREICGYDFTATKNLRRITSLQYSIDSPDLSSLIFAIHTYFSILLTLFAIRIGHILSDEFDSLHLLSKFDSDEGINFEKFLQSIYDGYHFKEVGITNLVEGTFFQWFIDESSDEVRENIKAIAVTFSKYSTLTLKMVDIGESDLIKDLYQSLSPPALRRALGEFYTPNWLADLALDRVGYEGELNSKILDPTCGSGTFLIRAISRYKRNNSELNLPELALSILENIRGIDLNPLAVTASKINYLLAMGEELVKSISAEKIEIPIYLSDSMLAPLEHKFETGNTFVIPTKVANFVLPKHLVESPDFLPTMTLIEEAIKGEWKFEEFKGLLIGELGWNGEEVETHLRELFEILLALEKEGINGVWAGIIKNFFAPSFMGMVDYIVGNPPWVNWENLPEAYRDSIKQYWSSYAYNLFRHKGLAARLGSAHDDICVLLTYIVSDVFLKNGGKIVLILPQTLFKSKGGGEGFRAFNISGNFSLEVLTVDDLVDVRPFDASNKTSVFCAQKGNPTTYPVPYYKWIRPKGITINSHHNLEAVFDICEIEEQIGSPIDDAAITSPWLTGSHTTIEKLKKLVGNSDYRARKGVDTSLNAVFWVLPSQKRRNLTEIENCQTRSRTPVRQKKAWIEDDALFPLLRGRDFNRWHYEINYQQILLYDTETGKPLPDEVVTKESPRAWRYFHDPEYKPLLEARAIYRKHLPELPIYSCYDIGPYSFSPFKVVWKALASGMQAVVIGSHEEKIIVPDHNVMMIPIREYEEAHYLCSVLNSSIATLFVTSYIEWFYSTHILQYFYVPKYNQLSQPHRDLASFSIDAHANWDNDNLLNVERQIDDKVDNLLFS